VSNILSKLFVALQVVAVKQLDRMEFKGTWYFDFESFAQLST